MNTKESDGAKVNEGEEQRALECGCADPGLGSCAHPDAKCDRAKKHGLECAREAELGMRRSRDDVHDRPLLAELRLSPLPAFGTTASSAPPAGGSPHS